jgi:hypothetical protein
MERIKRRKKKGINGSTKKETRSRAIWGKYGIPRLAIIAPVLVGTDIAAVFSFIFGATRKRVIGWMIVSLAIWTLVFAIGYWCSLRV